MAETNVQLPPNSTGQQIRIETGDSTNLIPTGVGEEVVILTDADGLFAGDGRMQSHPVTDATMQEVLVELRRHTLILSQAFGVDIPQAGDAMTFLGSM